MIPLLCPRCRQESMSRFFGPCGNCAAELRRKYRDLAAWRKFLLAVTGWKTPAVGYGR